MSCLIAPIPLARIPASGEVLIHQGAKLGAKDGKPAMLFASLDTLIRERREELPSGRTRILEDIIEPADFFSEALFAKLDDGKRRPLLVRY